jgi:hypothetical protein
MPLTTLGGGGEDKSNWHYLAITVDTNLDSDNEVNVTLVHMQVQKGPDVELI